MSNTKHTPGPWDAILPDPSFKNWAVHSKDHHICALGIDPPVEEEEANARLIAAAPELLEALQMFNEVDQFNGWHYRYAEAIAKARAAIAKATGTAA